MWRRKIDSFRQSTLPTFDHFGSYNCHVFALDNADGLCFDYPAKGALTKNSPYEKEHTRHVKTLTKVLCHYELHCADIQHIEDI